MNKHTFSYETITKSHILLLSVPVGGMVHKCFRSGLRQAGSGSEICSTEKKWFLFGLRKPGSWSDLKRIYSHQIVFFLDIYWRICLSRSRNNLILFYSCLQISKRNMKLLHIVKDLGSRNPDPDAETGSWSEAHFYVRTSKENLFTFINIIPSVRHGVYIKSV